MKTIGFLKMYNNNVRFNNSMNLSEMIKDTRAYTDLDKIINYLESGYYFTDSPVMLQDDEDKPMFGLGYQTDGEWIWPNYFAYYLQKYSNYEIDKDFLDYLKSKDFVYTEPDESQIKKVSDYFFANIW
ncbi:hypothetical protein ETU08_06230 [Apibacter muscae]|uniref:hypothetical protein n=1 Tax=Apibacter muscae TaxID=2509004 RepID=UPI0011AD9881|nr:hypothetical protein [Apibacter muscae]TWP30151.1 hypothetical protein ETU08_06230 [Apibacter muscae]